MATKISTELLIMILNKVRSIQDLHSSLLVNRIWCKITVPLLWKLIFGREYYMDDKELRKKALCIRTYISCMDTQARTLLTQNGFDLSSSPPQATFDYPSFTHKLIINHLVYFISIYSRQIIGPGQNNIKNNKNDETAITKSRILLYEIFKLIIERCEFVDSFKITEARTDFIEDFQNYNDLISPIFELPGAPKVFKNLESFTSKITRNDKLIRPLYESLTLICNNILKMALFLDSVPQMESFEKLISVQKRLESLIIVGNYFLNYDSLLWAIIISQKETLKRLGLKSINFCNFEVKSSPIGQFISLQELYIVECSGLHKSDYLFLASSFTQLSRFHYRNIFDSSDSYPQKFIIKILETANANLRNICLDLDSTITFDIFSAILNHCTKITKLTLNNLLFKQVIAIFNNNFNELRRFSFYCGGEEFDANALLCQMAENVPESLETIKIRMDCYNLWVFSVDSLRKFFEGWCCKGGEGNKKSRGLRIEPIRRQTFSPLTLKTIGDLFKIVEEYGIQFDIKESFN